MAKILIVDDTAENREILKGLLEMDHTIYLAKNGKQGIHLARKRLPDLILMDVMMPVMDGYTACRILKEEDGLRDVPVIFLTSMDEEEDEAKGLALGAVDYITKPIRPSILKERVKNHLELKVSRDKLKRQNETLEEKVLDRTRQMEELQDVTMVAMGALVESRDPETGNHIRRTQHYVRLLAQQLRDHPRFMEFLTPETITSLFKSAPLHDIGKVGVPDQILLKPGKLTDQEFEIMKKHVVYGRDAIIAAERTMTHDADFLTFAKEITYMHHEKWDGSGYVEGLSGDDIPISARLMAVADVYDALICKRIYKPPYPHEKAVSIIKEGRGGHFDPNIVDAFLEISDQFLSVSRNYTDQ
jgi:putative two-component system response regulator